MTNVPRLPSADAPTRRIAAYNRTESIGVLPLSERPYNCLQRAGIDTIGKLAASTDSELRNISSFGEKSLREVNQVLDEYLAEVGDADREALEPADPAAASAIRQLRRAATRAHEEGVVTIGQFVKALGADISPTWLDERDSGLLATPLQALSDPTMAIQHGWQHAMQTTIDAMKEQARAAVLETSPLQSKSRTLDQVGQVYGVTRERIRQLRVSTSKSLVGQPAIAAAVDLFTRLISPACPASLLVQRGFDPADDLVKILATVAQFTGSLDNKIWIEPAAGDQWYGTGPSPSDWLMEAVGQNEKGSSVTELDESFRTLYTRANPNHLHTMLREDPNFRVQGDRVWDWSGSLLDKCLAMLQAHGEPMTTEELIALVEPNNHRSLEQQLWDERKNGSRIVTTVERLWALPGWDVDEYTRGEDLMAQIIEELGGKASLRRLTKEVQLRGGFSPQSVHMWATMTPRFVHVDGVVRCRKPDEPIPVPLPSESGDMFRRLDDPKLGKWSTLINVDFEKIRTNSTAVPLAFVSILGIEFGGDLEQFIECNGVKVSVSWRQNDLRLHSSGGWRKVCESLGANDGDQLIFTAAGRGAASAWILPEVDRGEGPTDVIRALIGGAGTDDVLTDLAWAIGLDGELDKEFTLDDITALLKIRRKRELRDALTAIHPELDL